MRSGSPGRRDKRGRAAQAQEQMFLAAATQMMQEGQDALEERMSARDDALTLWAAMHELAHQPSMEAALAELDQVMESLHDEGVYIPPSTLLHLAAHGQTLITLTGAQTPPPERLAALVRDEELTANGLWQPAALLDSHGYHLAWNISEDGMIAAADLLNADLHQAVAALTDRVDRWDENPGPDVITPAVIGQWLADTATLRGLDPYAIGIPPVPLTSPMLTSMTAETVEDRRNTLAVASAAFEFLVDHGLHAGVAQDRSTRVGWKDPEHGHLFVDLDDLAARTAAEMGSGPDADGPDTDEPV